MTPLFPILAEATTDISATVIGMSVLAIAALCVAANQIDDFLDRRKSKQGMPPNEQLQQSLQMLTEDVRDVADSLRSHIKQNGDEHEGIHRKIGGVERGANLRIDEVRKEAREQLQHAIDGGNVSRKELQEQVTECTTVMGELRGSINFIIEWVRKKS